jgi:hypothetical protein
MNHTPDSGNTTENQNRVLRERKRAPAGSVSLGSRQFNCCNGRVLCYFVLALRSVALGDPHAIKLPE